MTKVKAISNFNYNDHDYVIGEILELDADTATLFASPTHEAVVIIEGTDDTLEDDPTPEVTVAPATPDTSTVSEAPSTPEAPADGGEATATNPLEPSQLDSAASSTDSPSTPEAPVAPTTDPTPEQIASDLAGIQ